MGLGEDAFKIAHYLFLYLNTGPGAKVIREDGDIRLKKVHPGLSFGISLDLLFDVILEIREITLLMLEMLDLLAQTLLSELKILQQVLQFVKLS